MGKSWVTSQISFKFSTSSQPIIAFRVYHTPSLNLSFSTFRKLPQQVSYKRTFQVGEASTLFAARGSRLDRRQAPVSGGRWLWQIGREKENERERKFSTEAAGLHQVACPGSRRLTRPTDPRFLYHQSALAAAGVIRSHRRRARYTVGDPNASTACSGRLPVALSLDGEPWPRLYKAAPVLRTVLQRLFNEVGNYS